MTGKRAKTYPILEHPGDGPAVIEPAHIYSRQPRIPGRCVLCFFSEVISKYVDSKQLCKITELPGEGEPLVVYRHGEGDRAVAVVWPGIGAPFAASTLEELIALGGVAFICVGGAGVLDSSIPVGQLMLPTEALRDEGTSYHYQKRGRFSRPHPEALQALREACQDRGKKALSVRTWTTDGVFRETPSMVKRRRQEGCHAVEMEAAAFFAVARFRGVVLGQALYAGDDVSGEKWRHRDWTQQSAVREELLLLALDACRALEVSRRSCQPVVK